MPELSSRTLFSSAEDICPNDLGCTEVNNFNTNVDARLKNHFRWKGKAIATIGLSLSPDNDKVAGGMLITRGLTSLKETRLACSVVWQDAAQDYYLVLNFPTVDNFRLVIVTDSGCTVLSRLLCYYSRCSRTAACLSRICISISLLPVQVDPAFTSDYYPQ
jgi:hypothetical protein